MVQVWSVQYNADLPEDGGYTLIVPSHDAGTL
jgi:hypothetical protein